MVHISAGVRSQGIRARDLWGRRNGRYNVQPNVVVFKEESPMVLKNFVTPSKQKVSGTNINLNLLLNFQIILSDKKRSGEKSCSSEMMELMSCLERFSGDKVC